MNTQSNSLGFILLAGLLLATILVLGIRQTGPTVICCGECDCEEPAGGEEEVPEDTIFVWPDTVVIWGDDTVMISGEDSVMIQGEDAVLVVIGGGEEPGGS